MRDAKIGETLKRNSNASIAEWIRHQRTQKENLV